MRTKTLLTTAFALGLLAAVPGAFAAEAADPRAEDRKALLAVFHEMEAGINAQDVERMIAQMAPEATVTWLNGEVSRGHDQIRAYYHRMVKDDDRILDRYTTAAKLGASARFYGDVAVADGTMQDAFVPVARGPFELSSNWTSTSAKIDGRWKVVSMHLSSNVFTNSLIEEAKTAASYAGAGGLLGGALLAGLVCRLRRRRTA
jgi:uncharacterized protein (TIGR02246 family)